MSLTRPVDRNYQPRVYYGSHTSFFQEIDPKTGRAISVAHIDPDSGIGGNGTVNNPFGSVAEYMALTPAERAAFNIIFVQPRDDNSDTNLNTGITLVDTQHLFGNGTTPQGYVPTFTSNRGTFALPGLTAGLQPFLTNRGNGAVPVVTLAGNATEVAGFRMSTGVGGVRTAIASAGPVDGFNIHHNTIFNVFTGIDVISNTAGDLNCPGEDLAIVANNSITGSGFTGVTGVHIVHTGGTVGLGITDNVITGFIGEDRDGDGQIFPTEDLNNNGVLDPGEDRNGNGTLDLSEDLNNNGLLDEGYGIDVEAVAGTVIGFPGGGTPPLGILRNETSQNGTGIRYQGRVNSTSVLDVVDNNSHDNQHNGLSFSIDGGNLNFRRFANNTATANGFDGVRWIANNGGTLRTINPMVGNNINGNRRNGMYIGATNNARMFFQIGDPNDADTATFDNNFNDNGTAGLGGDGVHILFTNGAQLISNPNDGFSGIYNASISRNQGRGVVLDVVNGTGGTTFNNFRMIANTVTNNSGDGVLVSGLDLNNNGFAGGRGLRNLRIINNNISLNVANGINFQMTNSDLVNHIIMGNQIDANGTAQAGPSQFDIEVVFGGGLTPSQQATFALAAARWSQIIIGDLPDVGAIDDVQIFASGVNIDGAGGILGQAGPTQFRPGTFLPFQGIMQFDSADLASLETSGGLQDVILHEMAHVLGFGTIWNQTGTIIGAGGADPRFTGANATVEHNALFASADPDVPVEGNTSGPGSADSHWRESIYTTELMTPSIIPGQVAAISRVTIGQWEDLGYVVNYGSADPFVPLMAGAASGANAINFESQFGHDVETVTIPTITTAAPALTVPLANITIVNPAATGNGINYSLNNSAVVNGVIENNDITNNGGDGISMENPLFGGTTSSLTVISNNISDNATEGADFIIGDNNNLNLDVRRNTIANNGSFGFHVAGNENATFGMTFGGPLDVDGNVFTGNGDANLAIELTDNSRIPGTMLIQNNTFNGAVDAANVDFDGEGVSLRGSINARFRDVRFRDNIFQGNASDGLRIDMTGFAPVPRRRRPHLARPADDQQHPHRQRGERHPRDAGRRRGHQRCHRRPEQHGPGQRHLQQRQPRSVRRDPRQRRQPRLPDRRPDRRQQPLRSQRRRQRAYRAVRPLDGRHRPDLQHDRRCGRLGGWCGRDDSQLVDLRIRPGRSAGQPGAVRRQYRHRPHRQRLRVQPAGRRRSEQQQRPVGQHLRERQAIADPAERQRVVINHGNTGTSQISIGDPASINPINTLGADTAGRRERADRQQHERRHPAQPCGVG
ncbi:MAG: right-handed parallel beta-helix repeat-containing protein [Planctomycetaceae bacterium]